LQPPSFRDDDSAAQLALGEVIRGFDQRVVQADEELNAMLRELATKPLVVDVAHRAAKYALRS